MEWIKTDQVQSGDIIETKSKIPDHIPICKNMMVPIIKHYGIVTFIEGKPYLVHNVIGRQPTITPLDEILVNRKINRVLRTGLTDRQIIDKYNSCKDRKYSILTWNCESLMCYMIGDSIGCPQQHAWIAGIVLFFVLIFSLIFFRRSTA